MKPVNNRQLLKLGLEQQALVFEQELHGYLMERGRPWLQITKRDWFPEGMNSTLTCSTWGRSSEDGTKVTGTIGTFSLRQCVLNGEEIEIPEKEIPVSFGETVNANLMNLAGCALDQAQEFIQTEFAAICGRKVVEGAPVDHSETFPAFNAHAISLMTIPMLLEAIMRDGGEVGLQKDDNQKPIVPVLVGLEAFMAIRRLAKDEVECSAVPQFSVTFRPSRWNLMNGEWVNVPYGDGPYPSKDYQTAEYEDFYIPHPESFEVLAYNPITTPPLAPFTAETFHGRLKYVEESEGAGYFRHLNALAIKPVNTHLGYTVRFARCPTGAED